MIFSVGIDSYPPTSGFAPLRYARRDAMLFSKGLFSRSVRKDFFTVELQRSEFILQLKSFLSSCDASAHVIYFAGHSFVCGTGTHLAFPDTKKGVEAETSVSVNDILRWTAHSLGEFLIVLDSCRNATDGHDFDYFSHNSAVLYSTSTGNYRYESYSVSKSFPATLERALRYLEPAFSLQDLRDCVNSEKIGFRRGNNTGAECASNPLLSNSLFSIERAVFEVSEIAKVEIFTSPGSERTQAEFMSHYSNFFDNLHERFSGLITPKPLDKIDQTLFALEVAAPRQFLADLLQAILEVAGEEFAGFSLKPGLDFEELASKNRVTKLPGIVPNGNYYMWENGQYLIRSSPSAQKIIPVESNVEIGLLRGQQIVAMCNSLGFFE